MIIKRQIEGKEYEFELTQVELFQAFEEEQRLIDIEDVEYYFEHFDDYPDGQQRFELECGVSVNLEEVRKNAAEIADILRDIKDQEYISVDHDGRMQGAVECWVDERRAK